MTDLNDSSERCVLCLDQKRFPVRIQCGHSFCYGCLDVYKSYKKYPWANKCPLCRNVLKEKRATKRKYSEINTGPESGSVTTIAPVDRNSAVVTNNSPDLTTLEQFIALATEDNLEAIEILSDDEVNYYEDDDDDDYGGEEHYETDSYERELDYYTDSDEDFEDENYYYYFDENVVENYQGSRTRLNMQNSNESLLHNENNGDVTEIVDVDSWNNSLNDININRSEIDWESVIATDVIIID